MRLQNFVAVFIVIGAIGVAARFVIPNRIETPGEEKIISENQKIEEKKSDLLSIKEPLSFTDSAPKTNQNNNKAEEKNDSQNLTDALVEILAVQIAEKNKNGLQEKNGEPAMETPSPSAVLDQFFSDNTAPSKTKYHPKVLEDTLALTNDTGQKAQTTYLESLGQIGNSYFANFSKTQDEILEEILSTQNAESARQLAKIYGAIANQYSTISVPANWADFHKAFLSHLYVAEDTWNSIANFTIDPLKAVGMIQFLDTLDQSAVGVKVLISQGIEKNNLRFP